MTSSTSPLQVSNNSRVQGWMAVKELLKPMSDGKPGLLVFDTCKGLVDDVMAIQHDDKNVSDCAREPHDITHRPDALRYFSQLRTLRPEKTEPAEPQDDRAEDYEDYMAGGEPDESYIGY